jgi:hypothetical protein
MQVIIEMLTRRVDFARFREAYFSDAFNRELVSAVNLRDRTVREREHMPDGKERLVTYVAPRVDLPRMIAKWVEGFDIGYEETSIYDPSARRADVIVHTPGGDRLQVGAVTHFREVPEGIQTHIDMTVRVKVLGLSALLERFVANETRGRYVIVERVLQQYVDGTADTAVMPSPV